METQRTTECPWCKQQFKNLKIHLSRSRDCSWDELTRKDYKQVRSSESDFLYQLRKVLHEHNITTYEVGKNTTKIYTSPKEVWVPAFWAPTKISTSPKEVWVPAFWAHPINYFLGLEVDLEEIIRVVQSYFTDDGVRQTLTNLFVTTDRSPTLGKGRLTYTTMSNRNISLKLGLVLKETISEGDLHFLTWDKGEAFICCMPERAGTLCEHTEKIHAERVSRVHVPPAEYSAEAEAEVRLNPKLPACYRRAILWMGK